MNQQKPFLQLQERRAEEVTFKFSEGIKRTGQFGPYYVYTVVHEGKEKLLKATQRLEKRFRELNVQAGQTLTLVRETVHPNKGEPFSVIKVVGIKEAPSQPEPKENPPDKSGQPPVDFSGDNKVMLDSIQDAIDITRTISAIHWSNTDVEKIGVSLFLHRTGQLSAERVLVNGNGETNRNLEKRLPF